LDRVNDFAQRGVAWQTRPGNEPGKQRPIHLTQATGTHRGDDLRAKAVTASGYAVRYASASFTVVAFKGMMTFTESHEAIDWMTRGSGRSDTERVSESSRRRPARK
jgi:hypothetical protein